MSTLSDECNAFSALLDSTYPATLDREAWRWRRVAKIGEEAGEVIEAMLGLSGENPRKGVTNGLEAVRKELLDVAFCALCALAHLDANQGDPLGDLAEHAAATHARLRAVLAPAGATS